MKEIFTGYLMNLQILIIPLSLFTLLQNTDQLFSCVNVARMKIIFQILKSVVADVLSMASHEEHNFYPSESSNIN